ncbi:CPBP family intramembrane glutamic endopeptidase [Clostridium frigidicarnis]|uniref:CAAX prenyl protease 2/Lysostaphin resistance protein A-like domain-containing protein n=1 Tax=Clostridium frigidicarnis TaxID=84698 RepID=A0A1I0ZXE7_9CLOT|nr:CPBP family intramembrane glutamic endopeptidase [Clostridium frigidicarnis]SFB30445.1 hypothetical protein SAMN04488528_102717 [Clostridium frigidicarnis]
MEKDVKRYLWYTFASSWILWGIIIIANQLNLMRYGTPLSMLFFIAGGLTPPICEIWIKKKYSSSNDYKSFIKSILNPRHQVVWYIIVIGLAFIFSFLPTLFGGATIEHPLYIAILAFPIMIIGGGLEEIGWRGFLQSALQKKFSIISSTVIVGIIWTVWHLPLWFISGSPQSSMSFLCFSITGIALSFLLAAILYGTKSVFLCIIFHTFINSFWSVFVPNERLLPACFMLIFAIVMFIVIEKKTNLILDIN